jgi:hypothetical protein
MNFAQVKTYENVSYQLTGSDGRTKPLFQEYRWTHWLIKKGHLSPLWINRGYAPFIAPFLGYWSAQKKVRNLITNVGFAQTAKLLTGNGSPSVMQYIAVGTNSTAAAVTDTALGTESSTSGLSRAAGSLSNVTTSVTNDTAQIAHTFSVTGTVAVTESGVLDAASTGNLLCHQVFSAINVVNGDSLAVTWKIQMH